MPNSIGIDLGGVVPLGAWQIIVTAILAAIGWGVKVVINKMTTIANAVHELTTEMATTATEMRVRNQLADERHLALKERIEDVEAITDRMRANHRPQTSLHHP